MTEAQEPSAIVVAGSAAPKVEFENVDVEQSTAAIIRVEPSVLAEDNFFPEDGDQFRELAAEAAAVMSREKVESAFAFEFSDELNKLGRVKGRDVAFRMRVVAEVKEHQQKLQKRLATAMLALRGHEGSNWFNVAQELGYPYSRPMAVRVGQMGAALLSANKRISSTIRREALVKAGVTAWDELLPSDVEAAEKRIDAEVEKAEAKITTYVKPKGKDVSTVKEPYQVTDLSKGLKRITDDMKSRRPKDGWTTQKPLCNAVAIFARDVAVEVGEPHQEVPSGVTPPQTPELILRLLAADITEQADKLRDAQAAAERLVSSIEAEVSSKSDASNQ